MPVVEPQGMAFGAIVAANDTGVVSVKLEVAVHPIASVTVAV